MKHTDHDISDKHKRECVPGCEHEHGHEHEHKHGHGHIHLHHHHHGSTQKNILSAFLLNFLFVIIEFAGGAFTNSIAIISDAIHDLGDCISIGCAYFMEKLSARRADRSYTYGYGRYSVLSALISAVILFSGSCIAISSSVGRIISPEEINAPVMAVISLIGALINGIAAFRTHGGEGLNERVISLHMLEDVLGWVAVFIGSLFILIFDVYIIDPILSVIISVYILIHAAKNLFTIGAVLTEKLPRGFDRDEYEKSLASIDSVNGAHHVHIWTISGEELVATIHLGVDNGIGVSEYSRIKREARAISEKFGISHLTVELCFPCEHDDGEYSCANCCDGVCDECTFGGGVG